MYRESENLEKKSSFTAWKEIIISLCAFAYKKGGIMRDCMMRSGIMGQVTSSRVCLERISFSDVAPFDREKYYVTARAK